MDELKLVTIRRTSEDGSIRNSKNEIKKLPPSNTWSTLEQKQLFLACQIGSFYYVVRAAGKRLPYANSKRRCGASNTLRNAVRGIGEVAIVFGFNDHLNEYISQPLAPLKGLPRGSTWKEAMLIIATAKMLTS
jgi:hypothetical protein